MESITIPVGPRLGDVVIEAGNLRKCYGDRVLMDNLSFNIPPASIVGKSSETTSLSDWLCELYEL